MKYTTLIISILFLLQLHAQTYHPLLLDSTVWKVSTYITFNNAYQNHTYSLGYDTTINGLSYKKIISSFSNEYIPSFMREDSANRKVYSIINGNDQLTYDFALNLNDSVYLSWVYGFPNIPIPSSNNGYYTVDSISIANTLAGPRKLMRLTDGSRRLLWMEGVGSIDDYLDYPKHYCAALDCGSQSTTYCQTKYGVETYERGPVYSCSQGLLYDCQVTVNSTHIDSSYVFTAHINGIGPYTYRWEVYDVINNWAVVDSTNYPSAHFVLSPNIYYSVGVTINDTITYCNGYSSVGVYDTSYPGSQACQSLFWIYPDTIAGSYLAVNLSSGNNLSYLWNFGDGTTSTLPYPSHQYATANKYEICLTVDNGMGCTDTHCDSAFYNYKTGGGPMQTLNVVNVGTGISNITQPVDVNLYPNPATGYVSFNASYNISGINIYNVTGSLISSAKSNAGTVMLSLATLTPGVYIAEIKAGNQSVMKRFIKL